MEYRKLGRSGLDVSPIFMGCMSIGEPGNPSSPWAVGLDEAKQLIGAALDRGINFFDTANLYGEGSSEECVGRVLVELEHRQEIVLATKLFAPMRPGPNAMGLSCKAIFNEIDNSLTRLRTDYVDLYIIHRYDPVTPIEETMEALHDVVKAGKARYLGASTMFAWQFAKAQATAERHGWTRFVSMQNHLNLLYREEEREMLPLCADQGVGVTPWSPLARDWDHTTPRSATDAWGRSLYAARDDDRTIVDCVGEVAAEIGTTRSSVALAWLLRKPVVTAPVVGIGKQIHLTDALAALDLSLSQDQVQRLEEPYQPHELAGFV